MSADLASVAITSSVTTAIYIFLLLYWILQVIAYWKIFKKAGERGWKSIIPLYNVYTQFKFSWKRRYFFIAVIALIAGEYMANVGLANGDSTLQIIGLIALLISCLILSLSYYFLGRSFGKGILFFIFAFFLPPIALLYLGFSSATYKGN